MEEAFEQCAMAMFGYMTDTGTVEPVDTVEVQAEGEDYTSVECYEREKYTKKSQSLDPALVQLIKI